MTTTTQTRPIRVAVYTRKSVTDGLDQEFNSLDAQRQAIESYVASQAGLGWVSLPKRYDDGGFSGANVDRPAFQQLLRDVEAGLVDVVAVYKIDRLSRSLRDFAKLVDLFEKHNVTFVSITQHFSTSSSMGRLTLNVLMSFAEYERETIAERITDKMQATRRRGLWTGGRPVLGYDVVDKRLVVNPDEAAQVRATFALYLELGTLRAVIAELKRRGWANKSFVGKRGQPIAGQPFTKATLHGLLNNVLYRGQTRCKDGVVPGVHEAIIDADLWDAVRERLHSNGRNGGATARNTTGAILRGMVRCGRCGSAMLHSFTTRGTRRYRFYHCMRAHNEGATTCPKARVSAGPFEAFVVDQIRAIGRDADLLAATTMAVTELATERTKQVVSEQRRIEQQRRSPASDKPMPQFERRLRELEVEAEAMTDIDAEKIEAAVRAFDGLWDELLPAERERLLGLLIEHVTYHPDGGNVEIELRPCGITTLAAEATR